MAADPKIDNAAAVAACNAIVDTVDSGGAGTMVIYDGTIPADADVAITSQNALVTWTLQATAFGAAADATPGATATLTAPSTANPTASATGTATFFRLISGGGNVVLQGTCGTSDADMIMSTTSIVTGENVTLNSMTFTVEEG